jgi:hypothetical protein
MGTITIRLPDAKHECLKTLARSQNLSLNKLFEEWATVALAQRDALASFVMRQSRGNRQTGLDLLDELDRHFESAGQPSE